MADEPFPLIPNEIRPRGEFPVHSDEPRPVLTADEAKLAAFFRLVAWREAHGDLV